VRHGTALTTSVPPRLFPERSGEKGEGEGNLETALSLSLCRFTRSSAESHPPRSASSRRSINLSDELTACLQSYRRDIS